MTTPSSRRLQPEVDVAWIDDDMYQLRPFKMAMELRGLTYRHFTTTSEFVEALSRRFTARLYLIDLMMDPLPAYKAEETDGGLRTGLYLARDLRKLRQQGPIVIFSNTIASHQSATREDVRLIKNTAFVSKSSIQSVGAFVALLSHWTSTGKATPPSKRLWSRIVDSVELKPNISGVGIDLKRLAADDEA